ncbi:MAG: hypothetical protein QM754_10760 [Tepidisphaeraceae bacterium]
MMILLQFALEVKALRLRYQEFEQLFGNETNFTNIVIVDLLADIETEIRTNVVGEFFERNLTPQQHAATLPLVGSHTHKHTKAG